MTPLVSTAAPPGAPGGGALAAGEVLAQYLSTQATELLRGLRDLRAQDVGGEAGPAAAAGIAGAIHDAAFRIADALGSFRPLLDAEWAERLETELYWLGHTVIREHVYAARRDRLVGALRRLSGEEEARDLAVGDGAGSLAGGAVDCGTGDDLAVGGAEGLAVGDADRVRPAPGRVAAAGAGRAGVAAVPAGPAAGVARAGALLERRLGLARSRAHSEALDALTSARFHALADAVALLVSDAPLTGAARRPAAALPEHHDELRRVLTSAVAALPLARAGRPYNAAALARGLAAPGRAGTGTGTGATADDRDDAPWRHVHALVRRARHAAEILAACPPGTVPVRQPGPPLPAAGAALDRDREAAEAAAAAASAAATPRIAPATAYALGVLHADQRHEVEAARFTFGRLWQTRGEQE